MNCPNAIQPGKSEPDPNTGALRSYHQCSVVQAASGFNTCWLADDQCGACTGDDGTSPCSAAINDLLAMRVIAQWPQPDPAPGCTGCLSLQQALALIVSRQGVEIAGQALDQAVEGGMPQDQAEALATANGIPLDAEDGGT
jgi:hypothetical protein